MAEDTTKYNFTKFHRMWRPAMAWSYLAICLFDFMIAPAFHGIFMTFFMHGTTYAQWVPLTLQGGGLYHTAMLAIIGVSAWGRTKEKLQILKDTMANANISPVSNSSPTVAPQSNTGIQ